MSDSEKKTKIIIKKGSKKPVGFKLKNNKIGNQETHAHPKFSNSHFKSSTTLKTEKKQYTTSNSEHSPGNKNFKPSFKSPYNKTNNDKGKNSQLRPNRFTSPQGKDSRFLTPQPKNLLNNKVSRVHSHSSKKKKYEKSAFSNEKEFAFVRNNKAEAVIPEQIFIKETLLVKELATLMNIKVGTLIEKLLRLGYKATLNDAIDSDTAEILASEFNCHVVVESLSDDLEKLLLLSPNKQLPFSSIAQHTTSFFFYLSL